MGKSEFSDRHHEHEAQRQRKQASPANSYPAAHAIAIDSPVASSGIRKALFKRRWFIRRLQGFDKIICDTDDDFEDDPSALLILMAKLSGAFSKGTEVAIVLTSGADPDL